MPYYNRRTLSSVPGDSISAIDDQYLPFGTAPGDSIPSVLDQYFPYPLEAVCSKEVSLTLSDEEPFPPTLAVTTQVFKMRNGGLIEEGVRVQIIGVFEDPTRAGGITVVVRVIDRRLSARVYNAVLCVAKSAVELV